MPASLPPAIRPSFSPRGPAPRTRRCLPRRPGEGSRGIRCAPKLVL